MYLVLLSFVEDRALIRLYLVINLIIGPFRWYLWQSSEPYSAGQYRAI